MFLFVALTAFSILVNSQINFALCKEAGYQKNGLIYLKLNNAEKSVLIKSEIEKLPVISSVSFIYEDIPTNTFAKMHLLKNQNSDENVVLDVLYVSQDFFKTMNIPLCNPNTKNFGLKKGEYIINKEAALKLKIDPKVENINLIGKGKRSYHIAGVCENFDIQGVQHEIFPTVIVLQEQAMQYLIIRSQSADAKQLITTTIHQIDADLGFSIFSFKDKMLDAYKKEANFLSTISLGSLIVIIISTIGLFNVIHLSLKRKEKEISIRKVFGASGISINKLIVKEFILLLITANLLSIPFVIWGINLWFQNFAYHVNINALIFVLTAFISLSIVVLTTLINVKIVFHKNLISLLNTA